jgi:hypothetical protein
MAMTFERCYRIVTFEWMLGGCTHQDWLWDHLFWSSNAHFTAWIWVITWTSIMMQMYFFSRSDLTSWEESMEKNFELITMSLLLQSMRCMSGRLGSSMKVDDHIYLKGMFQLEASSWLIDHLNECWHDAHNQLEDNSQKNPGEKILRDESSNTTLGCMVKLDKQWEQ